MAPALVAAVEIIPVVKIALEEEDQGRACNLFVMSQPLPGNTFKHLYAYLDQRRREGADTANPVVIAAQSGVHWRYVTSRRWMLPCRPGS